MEKEQTGEAAVGGCDALYVRVAVITFIWATPVKWWSDLRRAHGSRFFGSVVVGVLSDTRVILHVPENCVSSVASLETLRSDIVFDVRGVLRVVTTVGADHNSMHRRKNHVSRNTRKLSECIHFSVHVRDALPRVPLRFGQRALWCGIALVPHRAYAKKRHPNTPQPHIRRDKRQVSFGARCARASFRGQQ